MRQKNGYSRNPTSRMFRCCYANICTFSLMRCSELCNCEDDNDIFLTTDVPSDIFINEKTLIEHYQETDEVLDELHNTLSNLNSNLSSYKHISEKTTTTLETCSIVYFTGY